MIAALRLAGTNLPPVARINLILAKSFIATSPSLSSAKESPLFILRQKTGLTYSLCREALNKHQNNVEEARVWLEAQAMAHGLQKASKVRDRSAREGLLGIALSSDNKSASIIELNCETDFVAKNQIFKDFAADLARQFASTANSSSIVTNSDSQVSQFEPSNDQLLPLQDQIPPVISKLGENIKITRAIHVKAQDSHTYLFAQAHAKVAETSSPEIDMMLARFGALVGLKANDSHIDATSLKRVGAQLGQHVIGYNPTYIELPDVLRKQLEKAEKEKKERLAEEANQQSRDTDISDEARNSDNEDDISQSDGSRDDWPSIMDQNLILSDDLTVREFCKNHKVDIVYFGRFECGIRD